MRTIDHPLIELRRVGKTYRTGEIEVQALTDISLSIRSGESLAIMGPSGSGKSTLMNLIGCLDQPTSGEYYLDGTDVSRLKDDRLAEVRNRQIGFVFQSFNLLPRLSALENVELPLIYGGRRSDRRRRATAALEAVGLAPRVRHNPSELSGGERQRVAIARALVNEPNIILADEPTGNLDSRSGADVMTIFRNLNLERGITVVFVTHDPGIACCTDRLVGLRDGRIVSDAPVTEEQRREHAIGDPVAGATGGVVSGQATRVSGGAERR
ncbi:MAG: ABC transporter ATP-binding protein [Anaerolineae bacterium]